MHRTHGNPHNEAHGQEVYMIEWIAPAGTDPSEAPNKIEAVVLGLKLFHRGDNAVNGYINTRRNPDGTLLVQVCVYNFECHDPECGCGEGDIHFNKARWITDEDEAAMVAALGGEVEP